mgnify:CR=1 FL=1
MDIDVLNKEQFEAHLGSVFHVERPQAGAIGLKLEEITDQSRFAALDPTGKPIGHQNPFSLVFTGPKEPLLPQSLYALCHPEMGELTLFLKPFHQTPEAVYYEVVIN